MKTVLFIQLPPPRFSFQKTPTNIPLAAGFLISALGAVRTRGIHPHIPSSEKTDVYADQGLAHLIGEMRPSLVALTLYVWNVQRSLLLASRLKKQIPAVRVLVGGPEVTPDNEWVLRHPAVDGAVFGEGESRIAAAVEALARGRGTHDIPGTCFKSRDGLQIHDDPVTQWDLGACSYPYLDHTIEPARDGTLFLETARGCPFHCRYCFYHKAFRRVRLHAWQSIQEVLDMAYAPDSDVREIYLMDPTFNIRPGFREVLRSMIKRRTGEFPKIHTELRADLLNSDDVDLLKDAGLASAEIGLQSVNRKALRLAGRDENPDKIATGVFFLKRAGIDVTTGIIVGLPGDTPEGFEATVHWLKKTDAYSVVHPFMLSILPGTDFKANASELGLSYEPRPPYHVRSTDSFSGSDLRTAFLLCEREFDMQLDYIAPPSLVDRGPDLVASVDVAEYLSKWIVDPCNPQWRRIVSQVTAKAGDPFTIWFRGPNDLDAESAMVEVLEAFAQANPHAVVHVVLELGKPPDIFFFERALEASAQPHVYVNRSYQPLYGEDGVVSPNFILLIRDPGSPHVRERIKEEHSRMALVVWDLPETEGSVPPGIEPPFLISWSSRNPPSTWEQQLRGLRQAYPDSPEEVLFRDPAFQQWWNAMNGKSEATRSFPERILVTV